MKIKLKTGSKCMEFLKEDVNDVLELASLIVKKDSPSPSFSNISFFADGIAAMNEMMFMFHKTDTGADKNFGVSAKLFNIVDKNKDNNLTLNLGKKFLSISSKSIKARLSHNEEIERDLVPEIPEEFKDLPLDFIEALGRVKFASSKEEKRPEMYCFSINENNVYTTNGQIAAKAEFDEKVEDMLFPTEAYSVLQKFSPIKYAITESWVFFQSKETTVGVRQIESSDIGKFLIDMFANIKPENFKLPDEFKDVIEESGIFIDTEMGAGCIDFEFKEGNMILSSDNSKGEITKSVPCETDMESFSLAHKYLKLVAPFSSSFYQEKAFIVFFGEKLSATVSKISK